MRARTTDTLLADIKARLAVPHGNGLLTNARILALLDQEMTSEIAQILIATRSEYWVRSEDQTIVAGQAGYRIPDRALGMMLRDVLIVDSAGTEWAPSQVSGADRHAYVSGRVQRGSAPFAFTIEDGKVLLLPTPESGSYTLRLRYYAAPSRMVETSEAARVVSATASVLTLTSTAGLRVVEEGSIVDIVRGGGMFEQLAENLTVSDWTFPNLTISESLTVAQLAEISVSPTAVNYGGRQDYVCVAGETVFPPIPESLYPALVALGCRAVSEVLLDQAAYQINAAHFAQKKNAAMSMLVPRVDGAQIKIVPRNTPLRRGRWGRV